MQHASPGPCPAPAGAPTASGTPAITPLFDILPIAGTLAPGSSETAYFTFTAAAGAKGCATALCSVQGGPEYAVAVSGESNLIKYSLSSQFLDLGQQPYDKPAEREVRGQRLLDGRLHSRLPCPCRRCLAALASC